jgi:hypothetical protein
MSLRYAGKCEVCGAELQARAHAQAWYDPVRRRVRCPGCPLPTKSGDAPSEHQDQNRGELASGQAGVSAHREFERRSARHQARVEEKVAADAAWRQKAKQDHPVLGRVASAITPRPDTSVPQNVRAWDVGSDGEQKVGRRLDAWAAQGPGRFVLHDRRIPRTRANIDHLAVGASGVWVIDTKEYSGDVRRVDVGGLFRTDWRLKVGGRDRTKLVEGVHRQMGQVADALDRLIPGPDDCPRPRPPVSGVLCFVGAEWNLLARPFVLAGVHVAWPSAVVDLISAAGPVTTGMAGSITRSLAEVFPPA